MAWVIKGIGPWAAPLLSHNKNASGRETTLKNAADRLEDIAHTQRHSLLRLEADAEHSLSSPAVQYTQPRLQPLHVLGNPSQELDGWKPRPALERQTLVQSCPTTTSAARKLS
eukprot:COSAG02_NODE_36908_length_449_cov_0.588571_1_plen_112_part_10